MLTLGAIQLIRCSHSGCSACGVVVAVGSKLGVSVPISVGTMNRSWSIIANALDSVEWVQPFLEDRAIILCDGAYNHFAHGDLSQPVVIGDFDSIRTLDTASSQYVYVKDQNKTDGQKAIEYADRHGAQDILLLNVIGNDLGHTLHAIG